jgi:septum formation protein
VYFKPLSDQEIEHYIDTYQPFDKAGSYGVQEWIGYIGIEKIVGSYYNVMGLPIQRLYQELTHFIQEDEKI